MSLLAKGLKALSPNTPSSALCPNSFRTQSGLSTHKRHRHPMVRNDERAANAAAGSKSGWERATSRLWTLDEVNTLVSYLAANPGLAGNGELLALLPDKSGKQISDKKRSKAVKELVTERMNLRGAEAGSLSSEEDSSGGGSDRVPSAH